MSKHLERDLERLQKRIVGYAGLVEDAISKAVHAVRDQNVDEAREVIDGDEAIDRGENEVTEECLKLFALHQPVASDLRRIATTLMITTDLERMGDLAKHLAEAALVLIGMKYPVPAKLLQMAELTTTFVRDSLDAFVNLDTQLARRVVRRDDEVDRFNDDLIADLTAEMKKSPRRSSRPDALCRDPAPGTNRRPRDQHREDVIYLIEGEIVKHRPEAIGNEEQP